MYNNNIKKRKKKMSNEVNYSDMINIWDEIDKKKEFGNVNVIVANNVKAKVINNFVIMFYKSFLEIVSNDNITKQDIKVLLKILEKMEFGNLIKYTQESLAKELNTKQASISRSIKNLRDADIIIRTEDKEEYINPQLFNKGNLKKQKESDIYSIVTDEDNKNY